MTAKKWRIVLLCAVGVAALWCAIMANLISLPFFPGLRNATLGQVILSVNVINPDVPEVVAPPAVVASSNGGGGGGGGGSAASPEPAPTAVTVKATSAASENKEGGIVSTLQKSILNLKAVLSGLLNPVTSYTASTVTVSNVAKIDAVKFPSLTSTSRSGMTNAQVRTLKVFLNTHGYPVALTGIGSLGQENDYYGPNTVKALQKFQAAHLSEIFLGDIPAGFIPNGNLGPKTLKYIQGLILIDMRLASRRTN